MIGFKRILLSAITYIALAAQGWAEPVMLDPALSRIDLASSMRFLTDSRNTLGPRDFAKPHGLDGFQPLERTFFGITNARVWITFELTNPTDLVASYILDIPYPSLDFVDVYRQTPDGRLELKWSTGDRREFATRPLDTRTFAFPLEILPKDTVRYFLSIQSQGPLEISAKLWQPSVFQVASRLEYILFGLFYGVLFGLGLHNLILSLLTREQVYFSFAMFVFSCLLFFATWNGMGFQYLWPQAPDWGNYAIIVLLDLMVIWGGRFTMDFLEQLFFRYTAWLWGLRWAILLGGILFLLMPILSYQVMLLITLLYLACAAMVAIAVGIFGLIKGVRAATFYNLGWICMCIGCVVSVAGAIGLLPFSLITIFSIQIAVGSEAVLLSFGIGDRVNQVKKDRIGALQTLRSNLEVIFRTTQNMARVGSIAELGGIILETIENQLTKFSGSVVDLVIPEVDKRLSVYRFEKSADAIQHRVTLGQDMPALASSTALPRQSVGPGGVITPFSTELRGRSLLLVKPKVLQQYEPEELDFIATLSSVLGLSLDNIFYTHDLKKLVDERTTDLKHALDRITEEKSKTDLLLGEIRTGILTFRGDMLIEAGFSKYLGEIFEWQGGTFVGQDVMRLFFDFADLPRDALSQLFHSLTWMFGSDMMTWFFNENKLPRSGRFTIGGATKMLAMDWNPILGLDGCIAKIMLCFRDITRETELERALTAQNAQNDRILRVFGELIRVPRTSMKEGFADMFGRLDHLKGMQRFGDLDVKKAMIQLHTIKGNARMLGFSRVTEVAHDIETALQQQQQLMLEPETWSRTVQQLETELSFYQRIFLDAFSAAGAAAGAAVERPSPKFLLDVVAEAVAPARTRLYKAGIHLEEVSCKDNCPAWPEGSLRMIQSILLHAFNNAADHGYIFPQQNLPNLTLAAAKFDVSASLRGSLVELNIVDHGFGINFDKLRQLATGRGAGEEALTDEKLCEWLVRGGISSADEVSYSSGRGVGVGAIAAIARELNGSANICANHPRGTVIKVVFPLNREEFGQACAS